MIPTDVYDHALRKLLGPVLCHLDDVRVSEILINGPNQVYVERGGKLTRVAQTFDSAESLMAVVATIAQYSGRVIDACDPILEARLPDGSRVEAVLEPTARSGPVIAIRRFSRDVLGIDALIARGTLTPDAAAALSLLVAHKQNVIVAGGTGSGKTSVLNALSSFVPPDERVVVIEDASELQLQLEHVVSLEARAPDPRGRGGVSVGDLFRVALRLRPDRVVIGEIRGAEAIDLIQAMSSGHGGCMSTLHATHPIDALHRLETMALMSSIELPFQALRAQIASAVDVIIQVERQRDGGRLVSQVVDVGHGPDGYALTPLFVRRHGDLVATGALPRCAPLVREHGLDFPQSMLSGGVS